MVLLVVQTSVHFLVRTFTLLCSVPIATEKELSMADGVFNVEALAV
jgi:hypothetical protein